MKKLTMYSSVILLIIFMLIISIGGKTKKSPNSYYQVYLDGKMLGTIKSKASLENYIDSQSAIIRKNARNYEDKLVLIDDVDEIINNVSNNLNDSEKQVFNSFTKEKKVENLLDNKDRYNISDIKYNNLKKYDNQKLWDLTDNEIKQMRNYYEENKIYLESDKIYTPNGIEIKKVLTYNNDTVSIPTMYNKVLSYKNYTIPGYRFIIKGEDESTDKYVYVTDEKIFSDAIDLMASIFVGDNRYNLYKENNQLQIDTTGEIINNVYVQEDITYKAVNISTDEKIYTDAKDLVQYLLYGNDYKETVVTVNSGDSISSLSYNNQISVEEFLISNPEYTSEDNLLYTGKQVKIAKVNPQINIVEEKYSVSDIESTFNTVEIYDSSMTQGDQIITQEGENGIDRVSQNVKLVNGEISYVEPVSKQTIKNAVDKKVTVGTKVIPTVGSTSSWGWPTASGYTLSSRYGYRIAVFGEGNFHSGLDIAGTGYGSPVYATNNGVVTNASYVNSYGNHIIVNHNNGYYSLYGHLSGFAPGIKTGSVVARGQLIGYVGSSGWATGPHLHFEIRTCERYACTVNPENYL